MNQKSRKFIFEMPARPSNRFHGSAFNTRLQTSTWKRIFTVESRKKSEITAWGIDFVSEREKKSAEAAKNSSATDKQARLMDFLQKDTSRPHNYLWEVLHSIQIRHRKPHFFTVTSIVPLA